MFLGRLIFTVLLLVGITLQTVAQNPSCKVYKRDGDSFYFGKIYIPQGSGKFKLNKTLSNDAYVILYYGQLDHSRIYMKRMAVTEDCYYIDATECSHAFVVRTNIPDDVEFVPATADDDEIIKENNSYYFNKALSVQNSFRYAEEEVPNNVLQENSTYKKKNIYVMTDPATEGMAFQWLDQFGTTNNLPANSLYMTGSKSSNATEVVLLWPDDDIDDVVAIKNVKVSKSTNKTNNNAIYTMQGQRVAAPSKPGLYIINGRKTIVR